MVALLVTIAVSLPALHAQGPACEDYPLFCVPHVGYTGLAPHRSALSSYPVAWPSEPIVAGVVRGMTREKSFFLGDPTAPIHFLVFHSFTCSHCAGYYKIELLRFIEDYVLSGQAALEVRILSFSMQPYSDNAALAAICAGEQSAFWEMQHELFLRGSADGPKTAFDLTAIEHTAADLGLDSGQLRACVETGRYRHLLDRYWTSALDAGVSATPTVLYRQNAAQPWQKTIRTYENLAQLILSARQ